MAHSISRRQFLQGSGAAALSVAAAGLLSSCGGSSASNGGSTGAAGSSSTYTVLYSRQPATLNYLVCSADPDLYHGTQCIDTLVEYDNRGKIREGLATAWEWDADSLTEYLGSDALRGKDMLLALDGEDSPYLRKRCLLKDADAPVGEQVQKLFVLDKNNMASPETADAE